MAQRKMIITLHINGPQKSTAPNSPYSPEEIAEQTVECWKLGASVVHYHAVDPKTGLPSNDVELYAETVRLIKRECDIITFPTLGAHGAPSGGRIAHILEMAKDPATKPDCVPVDMLTTNLDAYDAGQKTFTSMNRVYSNTTETLIDISRRVSEVGVTPVPMIWNVAGVRVTQAMVDMGIFKEPLYCEVSIFGDEYRAFGHPATVKGLASIVDFFPPEANWRWAVNIIGGNGFAVLADTIERGGDPAIGLHDYPYPELGTPTNAELIGRVADLGRSMGREIATAAEAREMLGMPG